MILEPKTFGAANIALPRALALTLCLGAAPALAAQAASPPASPKIKDLGKFSAWTAATTPAGTKTICYAYTSATQSAGSVGAPVALLNVSKLGAASPAVVFIPGISAPKEAKISLSVGSHELRFSSAGTPGTAIAQNPSVAVEAFKSGKTVVAKLSGADGHSVTDSFSLRGYALAYAALTKACSG